MLANFSLGSGNLSATYAPTAASATEDSTAREDAGRSPMSLRSDRNGLRSPAGILRDDGFIHGCENASLQCLELLRVIRTDIHVHGRNRRRSL